MYQKLQQASLKDVFAGTMLATTYNVYEVSEHFRALKNVLEHIPTLAGSAGAAVSFAMFGGLFIGMAYEKTTTTRTYADWEVRRLLRKNPHMSDEEFQACNTRSQEDYTMTNAVIITTNFLGAVSIGMLMPRLLGH